MDTAEACCHDSVSAIATGYAGGWMGRKRCGRCGKTYPAAADYFYIRHKPTGRLDSMCRSCRRAINADWKRKVIRERREALAVALGRPLKSSSADDTDRRTLAGFTRYMMRNPHYFRYVFKGEPTPENIGDAFRKYVKTNRDSASGCV